MLNPNEIDPKHLPSMQAALLKNRSVNDEHRVSNIYRLAKTAFVHHDPKDHADPKNTISRAVNAEGVVSAICTDMETGLFVQLSGSLEEGVHKALLTFGHKYCQEYRDIMRQNISTKIW